MLIGLLVVSLIAGGVYLIKTQCPKGTIPIGNSCKGISLLLYQPTTQYVKDTQDNTANWKTYVNSRDGYSVKYPSDKYINCIIEGQDDIFLFEGGEDTRDCALGEEPTAFYVRILSQPRNFSKSNYPDCYSIKQEETTVANLEANKYTNIINNTSDPKKCAFVNAYAKDQVTVIVNYKNKNFEIYYNKRIDETIKEKILSTFKFTN